MSIAFHKVTIFQLPSFIFGLSRIPFGHGSTTINFEPSIPVRLEEALGETQSRPLSVHR